MKTLRSLCLLAVSATLGLGLAACVIKATDTSKARMPATLWITSPIVREGRAMAASQAPATIRPKEQKLAATNRHIEDSVPSPAAGSQHPTREAPVRYDRLTRATAVKSPTDSPLMPRMDLVIRADNPPEQMPVSVAAAGNQDTDRRNSRGNGRVHGSWLPLLPAHTAACTGTSSGATSRATSIAIADFRAECAGRTGTKCAAGLRMDYCAGRQRGESA